jgi:hypothetical protein
VDFCRLKHEDCGLLDSDADSAVHSTARC